MRILKKLTYLSVLFLSSCSLLAMQPEGDESKTKAGLHVVLEENTIGETEASFLPEVASNSQCQHILNLSYGYLNFCKDDLNDFRQSADYDEKYEAPFIHNIEVANNFIALTAKLDKGHHTVDTVLGIYLWGRLNLINGRAIKFGEAQKHVELHGKLPPEQYFVPTSPPKVEHLRTLAVAGQKCASANLQVAKKAIERYQFMNLMIYHLYKLTNPQTLSDETKRYISCSRTLWPILNDETTDLSYPDFAAITEDSDPRELKGRKDFDYFWANLEHITHEITMMNWCRQKAGIYDTLTRLEIVELEGKKYAEELGWSEIDKLSLPHPSWLYPEVNDPRQIVPELLSEDKRSLVDEVAALQVSFQKGKNRQPKRTENQRRRSQKQNQQSSTMRPRSSLKEHRDVSLNNAAAENSAMPESPSQAAVFETKKDIVAPSEEGGMNPLVPLYSATPQEISREELEESKSVHYPPQEDAEKELPASLVDLSSVTDDKSVTGHRDHLFPPAPRGVRVFHSKTPYGELELSYDSIHNRWRKLIDDIFDYRLKGQGFNFGEFKTLWEHLNGGGSVRSSGSGGSHYALLNRQGKVIMGIFAHGESQKYTRDTVRYLRAALNMIGISPSN